MEEDDYDEDEREQVQLDLGKIVCALADSSAFMLYAGCIVLRGYLLHLKPLELGPRAKGAWSPFSRVHVSPKPVYAFFAWANTEIDQ